MFRNTSHKSALYFCFLVVILGSWNSLVSAQVPPKRYKRVMDLMDQEKFSDARVLAQELCDEFPDDARCFYSLGTIQLQLKDYGTALVNLNKSISLDPALKEAYFSRYIANKETRNFQFALADINRFLQFHPSDTTSHWARYDLAIYMKENDEAIADGQWFIDRKIGGDSMVLKQLKLLEEDNRYREQLKLLNKVIGSKTTNVWWYYHRAFVNHTLAEYQNSLEDLEKFLAIEPKYIPAMKLRFDNHFYLRNLPICEKYIVELIDLEPENGSFHGDYGHILLQKGDWAKAESVFDKAIGLKSENLGYVYLGRAIAKFNQGQKDLACSDWERSLLLGESVARKYLTQYCGK
jgi:tetratricopeptide (TPR) repeat protein